MHKVEIKRPGLMPTYILDDLGEPVREPNPEKFWAWAQDHMQDTALNQVGHDEVGDSEVDTVFIMFDHGPGSGEPILWETMVFGGPMDKYCFRCGGPRAEALEMHEAVVEKVKEAKR